MQSDFWEWLEMQREISSFGWALQVTVDVFFLAKAQVCVRQRLCWLCGMLGTGGEFCGGGW